MCTFRIKHDFWPLLRKGEGAHARESSTILYTTIYLFFSIQCTLIACQPACVWYEVDCKNLLAQRYSVIDAPLLSINSYIIHITKSRYPTSLALRYAIFVIGSKIAGMFFNTQKAILFVMLVSSLSSFAVEIDFFRTFENTQISYNHMEYTDIMLAKCRCNYVTSAVQYFMHSTVTYEILLRVFFLPIRPSIMPCSQEKKHSLNIFRLLQGTGITVQTIQYRVVFCLIFMFGT